MIAHLLFWSWYSVGAVLLIFFRVPDALKFSNGLFLVFYGLYALYLLSKGSADAELNRETAARKRVSLALAAAGIWLGGMAVEWLGVHTGWPFGIYEYTDLLGMPVFGVPVTMGFAWMAVVCSGALLGKYDPGVQGRLRRALATGSWTVLLDLCLDPVAFERKFWFWQSSGGFYGVPVNNYFSWFVIGGLLSVLLPDLSFDRKAARQGTFLYQMILLLFGILALKAGLIGSFAAALLGIILAEGSLRYANRNQVQTV